MSLLGEISCDAAAYGEVLKPADGSWSASPVACFTQAAAEALVRANYAIVVLDYPSFDDAILTETLPGIPLATLVRRHLPIAISITQCM